MNETIFELMNIYISNYLKLFSLDYNKMGSVKEINSKIRYYETYGITYNSIESKQQIEFELVRYTDTSTCFIRVKKFEKNGTIDSWLDFVDYFSRYKNKPECKVNFSISNNLETLDSELKQFFDWLTSVTDAQLINILQGKDWVDIPFDWGGYR